MPLTFHQKELEARRAAQRAGLDYVITSSSRAPEPEPLKLPLRARFQGQWTIGRAGSGKTQLFQYLLYNDLLLAAQGKASIIVLDSTGGQKGRLIHTLSTLKCFAPGGALHNRLIYIDPTDSGYTLPINLLSLRPGADDDQAIGSAIDSYVSIMGGLMGQPLTGFQLPVFSVAVQAALTLPNPSITTLRDIIGPRWKETLAPAWNELHPDIQSYFTDVYNSEGPKRSRSEILSRLYNLMISTPLFRKLFTATETKIDFFDAINEPNVIVINADRSYLQSLTELYGRYFLALITQAGQRRASMPLGSPIPCFIYIDECDEFVSDDENAAKILLKLRGMNMALLLGNQQVSKIRNHVVQESFLSTAIKFVNTIQASALVLAPEMNCLTESGRPDTSLLTNRPDLDFAFFMRGMARPTSFKVPHGLLEAQPHMTDVEFENVRAEIRAKYYIPTTNRTSTGSASSDTKQKQSEQPPPHSEDELQNPQSGRNPGEASKEGW